MIIRFEDVENKFGVLSEAFLAGTAPDTAGNYGVILTIMHPMELLEVAEVHGVASSSGTVLLEKLLTAVASGSGIAMTAAISTAGTADTVQFIRPVTTLTNGVLNRVVKRGDRIGIKAGGTLTGAKDLHLALYFKPLGRGDFR
jgi:hypothetical protein